MKASVHLLIPPVVTAAFPWYDASVTARATVVDAMLAHNKQGTKRMKRFPLYRT